MITGWVLGHTGNNLFIRMFTRWAWAKMAVYWYGFCVGLVLTAAFFIVKLMGLTDLIAVYGPVVAILGAFGIIYFILIGAANARRIKVTRIRHKSKRLKRKKVRIVMVSDMHIGTILGNSYLARVRAITQKLNPDVLICAGDIIDINPKHLKASRSLFKNFLSSQKTYAVTGNHEYISNRDDSVEYLTEAGARFLENDISFDKRTGVVFAGVEDPMGDDQRGDGWKVLDKLLKRAREEHSGRPVVVISHQPKYLNVAMEHGVELMLCGHTHAGQMWPFGYMVRAVFGKGWIGRYDYLDTTFYTGNGTGIWGPPIRVGSVSEIVVVDLFKEK